MIMTDKLEALSAALVYYLFFITAAIGIFLTVYLAFFTRFWYIPILYYIWVLYIDRETPEKGGRKINWVCDLPLFKYAKNYFPIKIHLASGLELDFKRNYLFGIFPHGFIPVGAKVAFLSSACNVEQVFKWHRFYGTTLKLMFMIPLTREYCLSMGICCVSAPSIGHVLSQPKGGNMVGLVVGGVSEMFYCDDKQHKITLKNRKGYARLALMHGSPLIPTFVFGETSVVKQKVFPKESLLGILTKWLKDTLGIPFVLVYGRGLFYNKFGLIPLKHPLNVVAGLPIDVIKNENPSQEDIDVLHQTFISKLTNLFEEYKYQFEKDPENCKLTIA